MGDYSADLQRGVGVMCAGLGVVVCDAVEREEVRAVDCDERGVL